MWPSSLTSNKNGPVALRVLSLLAWVTPRIHEDLGCRKMYCLLSALFQSVSSQRTGIFVIWMVPRMKVRKVQLHPGLAFANENFCNVYFHHPRHHYKLYWTHLGLLIVKNDCEIQTVKQWEEKLFMNSVTVSVKRTITKNKPFNLFSHQAYANYTRLHRPWLSNRSIMYIFLSHLETQRNYIDIIII